MNELLSSRRDGNFVDRNFGDIMDGPRDARVLILALAYWVGCGHVFGMLDAVFS